MLIERKKQRVYTLRIDSTLDMCLKAFEKQLNEDEEIVNIAIDNNQVIVVTKESQKKLKRDLLLEKKMETKN